VRVPGLEGKEFNVISPEKSNLAHAALLPLFHHRKHLSALFFIVQDVFAANVKKLLRLHEMPVAGGIQFRSINSKPVYIHFLNQELIFR